VEEIKKRSIEIWKLAQQSKFYLCIREFLFIIPRSYYHPRYEEIKLRFPTSKILDLGCCMGTDSRQFIVDGAVPENIVDLDIESNYFELGHILYGDKETSKMKFLIKNILEQPLEPELAPNTFDIIYCGAVIHLLLEPQVLKFCTVAFSLLKENGLFFGQALINNDEIIYTRQPNKKGGLRFLHCVSSLKQLLENIGFKEVEISVKETKIIEGVRLGIFYGVKRT